MREQRKGEGGGGGGGEGGRGVNILGGYAHQWGDTTSQHFTSTLDMEALQVYIHTVPTVHHFTAIFAARIQIHWFNYIVREYGSPNPEVDSSDEKHWGSFGGSGIIQGLGMTDDIFVQTVSLYRRSLTDHTVRTVRRSTD